MKQSNVLLAVDGIPRLADLRVMSGLTMGATGGGEIASPGLAYLPPEFLDDPASQSLPVTDNYGHGAILYELVAGRAVFSAESSSELLEQIRSAKPVLLRELNPEAPQALEDLCKKCLRKKPWWRPARAFDVLMTVRTCLKRIEGGAASGRR